MASPPQSPHVIRFGLFEVDLSARELRKSGLKLKVHEQTFQVLSALLEHPGEVVTREELRRKLWPGETFVDFDHGINTAVKKLREVLGDSADNPRFVETLARRGYRFLAPVDVGRNKAATTASQPVEEVRGIEQNSLGAVERPEQPPVTRTSRCHGQLLPWTLVAILSLAVVFLATAYFRKIPREAHLVRFQIPLPEQVTFDLFDFPVISPNGERVVIAGRGPDGKRHLWVRSLDSHSFQLLAGTEECPCRSGKACLFTGAPFWSPDSRSVAFFCNDEIRRIDVTSRLSQTVCKIKNYIGGGAWRKQGIILVSQGDDHTFYSVSAAGGELKPVLQADKSLPFNDYPQFLPDGRHFLYCSKKQIPAVGNGAIYLASLDSTQTKMLIPVESNVSYAPPGFLIYGRQETLLAQPFDVNNLRLTRAPAAIREPVARYAGDSTSYFTVSENGVLVYRGPASGNIQLAWYSRDSTRQASVGEPGRYSHMNVAPDGRRLAAQRSDAETRTEDIWSLELSSGIFTRVTSSGDNLFPVMSPDGREVVFSSERSDKPGLYRKVLGSGAEEMLLESNEWPIAQQWLKDGSILFFFEETLHTFGAKGDFYRLPMSGERKPVLLFKTAFAKRSPHVSSDGRWLAYQSDESGTWEVYLAAFPSFTKNQRVSVAGGCQPVWRKDGKELFYLSLDGKLMSIDVSSGATGAISVPRVLFQVPFQVNEGAEQYSVTGDGNKFLFAEPVERTSTPITVVLNWTEGLKP
ncbi:MAG: Serine/threonine protein kinase [Bryobacterales bacterium]|nr:Serine/threonine protein kinase [Bryobacterales bacterium]